jgi:hypothetical protein
MTAYFGVAKKKQRRGRADGSARMLLIGGAMAARDD